jgi:hypothetical protein
MPAHSSRPFCWRPRSWQCELPALWEGIVEEFGRLDSSLLIVLFLGIPGGAIAFGMWTMALARADADTGGRLHQLESHRRCGARCVVALGAGHAGLSAELWGSDRRSPAGELAGARTRRGPARLIRLPGETSHNSRAGQRRILFSELRRKLSLIHGRSPCAIQVVSLSLPLCGRGDPQPAPSSSQGGSLHDSHHS